MDIKIISEPLSLTLYGLSAKVEGQDYPGVGRCLMDEMWQEIWDKQYSYKGINHWLYEGPDSLFVGVELESEPDAQTILQRNQALLAKYAYWKHVSAYTELGKVHDGIHQELRDRGIQADWPSVEIYGHWAEDETELETEVLVNIRVIGAKD